MKTSEGFNKLVDSFAIFTFDLNLGQTCEYAYPPASFSAEDLKAISMLSFPDSQTVNSNNFDCVYTFSYRSGKPSPTGLPQPLQSQQPSGERFHQCYVYFRQVEDMSNPRGYYQKSFVMISSRSRTFQNSDEMFRLVRSIGNKFYLAEESGFGREILVDSYNHLEKHGISFRRGSYGEIAGRLSPISTRSSEISDPGSPSRSSCSIDTVYSLFEGLWHLWEALMVGLPVLVYAPEDVDVCSHTVLAVSRLIQPIEYLGDIRPFLSIFDEDYPSFRSPNAGACVVGITSPMALSQLIGFFSVIIVISTCPLDTMTDSTAFLQVAASPSGSIYVADAITSVSSGTRTRVSSLTSRIMFSAVSEGYRLALASDAIYLSKRIVTGLHMGDAIVSNRVNRSVIQRHFTLLTKDFLIPFVEYVETDTSVLPSNAFGETPKTKSFSPSGFVRQLSVGVGRNLSQLSQEKLRSLYSAFIKTESFRVWLRAGQDKANQEAIVAHSQTVIRAVTGDRVMWLSDTERKRAKARALALASALGDTNLIRQLEEAVAILSINSCTT